MTVLMPLVSVVVVSWNRKEDVRRCLESVGRSTYSNIETIVVDNDSTDGTVEMIRQEFSDVRLIETGKNLGCGPGRNVGHNAARGKYLVQIDDDATINKEGIEKLMDIFESEPRVGAVAFKVIDVKQNKDCTKDFTTYTKNFMGGGAGIRASVWKQAGPYPRKEFFSNEELDFCLRLHDRGYTVKYTPEIVVKHYSPEYGKRVAPWRIQYAMASWLWLFAKYFPWPLVPVFWARILTSYFILAVKHRRLFTFSYSVAFAIWELPGILKGRRMLKAETVRYFWNPNTLPDRYNIPLYRKVLRKIRIWRGKRHSD